MPFPYCFPSFSWNHAENRPCPSAVSWQHCQDLNLGIPDTPPHVRALLEECQDFQHISEQGSCLKWWRAKEFWNDFCENKKSAANHKPRWWSGAQGGIVGVNCEGFDPDGSLLTQHILSLWNDHIHPSDNIKSCQDAPFPLFSAVSFSPTEFQHLCPSIPVFGEPHLDQTLQEGVPGPCLCWEAAIPEGSPQQQKHPQLHPAWIRRRNSSFWQSWSLVGSWIGSSSCLYLPFTHLIRHGDRCPLLRSWAELLTPSKKKEIHY